MAALSLSGSSDAPLPELFHCQVVCLDHATHFRLQFHPQFTNALKRQCQLYSCLVTYESNANHWIHWSVQKFHSAVSILPTSFLPPKTKPSQQRRHRHIHRPVWRGIYLHCANSFDRVKDDAWVYSVYLHSANSFDRVNDDAQVSTFTMQMALTGSMMMPKSTAHTFTVQTALTGSMAMPKHIPSQCKWLWQGQQRCPSLQCINFTVQTALTGSMAMPKHIPSQCKWLWQGQQRCPSLQCITLQYKQLWQGQWRCPSTYLHSANGFDRVNNDAQVYSAYLHSTNSFDRVNGDAQAHTFTVQMALTGSTTMPKSTVHNFTVQTALTWSTMMPKHILSQCKRLWQGQQWCPSLQCITSQCKQLWQDHWWCPSTYLHSANGFDRVNDDAQAHTFTVQTALTGSMSMPKHIPSQSKQLWQGRCQCPSTYLHSANSFDRINDDAVFLQLPFVDLEVTLVSNALPQFIVVV